MKILALPILFIVLFSTPAFAELVKCENLRWKLVTKGTPATYRGSIKAGSADYIELEVRRRNKIIAQDSAYPNGGGNWEMLVYGDSNIIKSHKEKFYCHKY